MFVKVVALLLAVFLAVESERIVGAPQDADPTDPEVQAALQFAVAQYNAENDSVYISQVDRVIKAQTQIVSGIKYIFTVKMAKTSCKKGETVDSCCIKPDPNNDQSHECTLAVWSQPWLNSMILTENTC